MATEGTQDRVGRASRGGPTSISLGAPASLPANAGTHPSFTGAVDLTIDGGTLDPAAAYRFHLGSPVADGTRFLVAQQRLVSGQIVLVAIGFGLGDAQGHIVFDPCWNGACLGGFAGSGSYVFFALPADAAIAAGTVRSGGAAHPEALVSISALPVVSVSNASGEYALPVPAGVSTTLTATDPVDDLRGTKTVEPAAGGETVIADLDLLATPPTVINVSPPNHGSNVGLDAPIVVTFSEPLAPASIGTEGIQLLRVDSPVSSLPTPVLFSLSPDATQLTLRPQQPLATNTVYRLVLTSTVTDRAGHALVSSQLSAVSSQPTPPNPEPGTPNPVFTSDFTTASIFKAAALPPDTLRVSLPDIDGRVFVCGGQNLAVPGDEVSIENRATGLRTTVVATYRDPGDPTAVISDDGFCQLHFAGQCDTSQPGTFCAVLDTVNLGDPVVAIVKDAFGNPVVIEPPPMRDERTGATAIGPEGGRVTAVEDSRYRLDIPEGTFETVTLVALTPLVAEDFPQPTTLQFLAGAYVDFGGAEPLQEVDLSVPAPEGIDPAAQFAAGQVVNFRGRDEITIIDSVSLDLVEGVLTTDSFPFPGVRESGPFGILQWLRCASYVSGFADLITTLTGPAFGNDAVIPGRLETPFFLHGTQRTRFAVPVPCDEPIRLTLETLTGEVIDTISLSTAPRPGQFVFTEDEGIEGLFADQTPPTVIPDQISLPAGATQVGHDAEISIPFTEPILTSSLTPEHVELRCQVGGVWQRLAGTWSQSAEGRRIFFVPAASQTVGLRGLPMGARCQVRIRDVKDRHDNVLEEEFVTEFHTFAPAVLDRRADINAMAVDAIGWHPPPPPGSEPSPATHQYVAFAEGVLPDRPDSQGGLTIVDHTSLAAAHIFDQKPSAGLDRAVRFVDGGPITDQDGTTFPGPFLMTLDGAGDQQSDVRFGVWRLFDLSAFPLITPVTNRIVNHSAESLARFRSVKPDEDPAFHAYFREIPGDVGYPLGLASAGPSVAYIANAPWIGIEALRLNGLDRDKAAGIDGLLGGHYRAVATVKGWLIGGRADGPLDLVHPSLSGAEDRYLVSGDGLYVITLENWPVDRDRNGKIEADETFDLVVTPSVGRQGAALQVVAVDAAEGTFAPQRLEGTIVLPPGSTPRHMYADPERRLLYVANGTYGVTVVDFQDPSGSLDEDLVVPAPFASGQPDGIDDRVLGHVPLPMQGQVPALASAWSLATDVTLDQTSGGVDRSGHVIGYVAAHEDGWFWVDLGPARMELKLVRYASEDSLSAALAEPAEVRYFNERRTSLYQIEARLPGRLPDLYPTLKVDVQAVDLKTGEQIVAPSVPGAIFAPTGLVGNEAVELGRVPGTNRYTMSRNAAGQFEQVLLASNLPLDMLSERYHLTAFANVPYRPIYAGVGTKLKLTARVAATHLQGKQRSVPAEKLDVIVLGIDGLRQDVFYPGAENLVDEPGMTTAEGQSRYYVAPKELTGIGQVFGGLPLGTGGVRGDLELHHLRLPGVTAVFPSITLASWASIFTGEPPGVTGMLGNEFFMKTPVPNVKYQPLSAEGLIVLDPGAFPRSPTDHAGLAPDGGATYLGPLDPRATTQNDDRILQATTIFEELKEGTDPYLVKLRERYSPAPETGEPRDDLAVAVFNHYSRGASKWLTLRTFQKGFFLIEYVADQIGDTVGLEFGREPIPFDVIPNENAIDYLHCSLRELGLLDQVEIEVNVLQSILTKKVKIKVSLNCLNGKMGEQGESKPGKRNARPFPALFTYYLAGLDHGAHDPGHGDDAAKYTNFLRDHTDEEIQEFVATLYSLGEFHNKIFILTADHGHTRVTDDASEHYPCKLEEVDGEPSILKETKGNNNLHIWELARIVREGNTLQSAFRPRLRVPVEHESFQEQIEAELGYASVTTHAAQATIVAALNGPMAHLYVRPSTFGGWASNPPSEKELGVTAEIMRLFLMGSQIINPDGTRTFRPTFHPAFEPIFPEDHLDFELNDTKTKRLKHAVDFILLRLNGEYVVYNGLEYDAANPNPDEFHIRKFTLEEFLALPTSTPNGRERYANAIERIREMNHPDRSGDIVLVMRNDTDEGPPERFTAGVPCRAWHGSLNRSDSYVPLVLSYPGGNRGVLEEWTGHVCNDPTQAGGDPRRDCRRNKAIPELLKGLFEKEYVP